MFVVIDDPAVADQLHNAGLLWWRNDRSQCPRWVFDDPMMYNVPSATWHYEYTYAVLTED